MAISADNLPQEEGAVFTRDFSAHCKEGKVKVSYCRERGKGRFSDLGRVRGWLRAWDRDP